MTKNLNELIKATLFVSGEGIEINEFGDKFGFSINEVKKSIEELKKEFSGENGIHLISYNSKIQLSTNPYYAEEISAILNPIRERALTKATMQTLAIIAYKQPITRLDIETIRGVSADYTIQVLLEHNLIEVVGRKDVIGKPLLFGTTDEFLKRFDLGNLEDLPEYTQLLERIKIIKTKNEQNIKENLYKDIELTDDNSQPENQPNIEEFNKRMYNKEEFTKKIKNIDSVIRNASKDLNSAQEMNMVIAELKKS